MSAETFLSLSPKISVIPLIHGSGDFAIEVRRRMLSQSFDCLAVPLPESFQSSVEDAIDLLPQISCVLQREAVTFHASSWTPDSDRADEDEDDDDDEIGSASYVPIDPCQGVITALRVAIQEHLPRAFIDLETARFEPQAQSLPDAYALKRLPLEKFAAGVLPAIPAISNEQIRQRVAFMAERLRALEEKFERILFLCSFSEWPWIKQAYFNRTLAEVEHDEVGKPETHMVDPDALLFFMSEFPFIAGLYERARETLDRDENLSIDGLKTLLLETRNEYREEFGPRARSITSKTLALFFQYVRNLCLVERRLTPDMYTLVVAARQIAGDQFAIQLAETLREYPYKSLDPLEEMEMSIGKARLPNGDVLEMHNRLPGLPVTWRSCELQPRPEKQSREQWSMRWNPFSHCSWPPEDVAIERFRTHLKDFAKSVMGDDLARIEKFTTSVKDGLDIRETLRNWHTGELYVKEIPPARGELDCVIMLFDSPADPRDYPWRITWHAESHDESTLTLFATDFQQNMVGPGIALATYGGAMFLFPPRNVREVWSDPRFDFVDTLEERLIVAGCHYSRHRHIALLSAGPPGRGWKMLAKRYGKKLVHIPLRHFSDEKIQQLRMFHVLNGQEVRSYAAHFIRKA